MVTTFSLEPGYVFEVKTTPEMIQEITKTITVEQLKVKCAEYGLTEIICEHDCRLDDYLEKYRKIPTDDLTCTFYENGVMQSASGGTEDRNVKEIIRRAFGILVLDACYKKHLSVSFIIS